LEPPDTVGEPPADADAPAVTAVLPASPLPEDFPGGEPLPPRAALQVAALEHWLDTILAERRKRT
jgi:hypothetical protein